METPMASDKAPGSKVGAIVLAIVLLLLGLVAGYLLGKQGSSPVASPTPIATIAGGQVFTVGDLTMTLPSKWTLESSDNTSASINTHYQPYYVSLKLSYGKSAPKQQQDVYKYGIPISGGGMIYRDGCSELNCSLIYYDSVTYSLMFYVASDQPIPTDLDGIWRPDHNVSEQDIQELLKTIVRK